MIEENRQVYEFDEFRLDAAKRQLLREGEVVPLYSKAFDLLLLLVQSNGRDLSKDEILETIWPDQILEESNLTVNISAVRRALGEKAAQPRHLITIPGRGYRFVADLRHSQIAPTGLVVESQTISQITVEEISEPESLERQLPAAPRPVTSRRLILTGIVVVVALGIGGYLVLHRIATRRSAFPFELISIKRLTTKGIVSRAALSPDGKLFVYSIPEGELESLWLGHVDGGEPIQIRPPDNQVFLAIKFTPDGSAIYYSVSDNHHNRLLYRMPVFGGAPEKIRENFNGLTFSSDGRQYAFLRYDENRKLSMLVTAETSGGNEREVALMPKEISSAWHSPAWSPDGLSIVVAASVQVDFVKLFVVNLAQGSTKVLTQQTWRALDGISWLKDGSGLVSVGLEKSSLHSQLWFISFPGGEARRLIADLNDYGYVTSLADDNSLLALQGISESNIWVAPAGTLREAKQISFDSAGRNDGWNGLVWTRDGRIIYAADDNDGTTLWAMNSDGSKSKQLIPSGGVNSYPSITADGRSLIFHSNRSGHFAVWRADLDGGNMAQVTRDQIAAQPFVSPDGKWIVYISTFDSLGELWRIPAAGGEPFRMSDKLAGWAQISPDSKFVACELHSEGKAILAIFSLEGGELVKSFELPRLANLRLGVHWTPDGKAVSYRDWANGIWKQSFDGGQPERLEGLPEEKFFAYNWSPDGKLFAFSRGATTRDVVLIKRQE